MKRLKIFISTIFLLHTVVLAEWFIEPEINTPVCVNSARQSAPQVVSDSLGGMYIAWQDERNESLEIYVQHLDSNGDPLWQENGIPIIETVGGWQYEFSIVNDNHNGCIVVWSDTRSGYSGDIYGQRINSAGSLLWEANGKILVKAPNYQGKPKIISSGQDKFILVWEDKRNDPVITDLYVNQVDINGVTSWQDILIDMPNEFSPEFRISSDKNGGVYVGWESLDGPFQRSIRVQKINNYGSVAWPLGPVSVMASSDIDVYDILLTGGDLDKVNVVWAEQINGHRACCAQLSVTGAIEWTYMTDYNKGYLINLEGASDGLGSNFIHYLAELDRGCIWTLVKVESNGSLAWKTGWSIDLNFEHYTSQANLNILSDGSIVTVNCDTLYKARRTSTEGLQVWQEPVVPFSYQASQVCLVGDGSLSTFAIFTLDENIYAHKIFDNEAVPVELSEFDYVLQKGHVVLSWCTLSESNNFGFEIQRCKKGDTSSCTLWEKIGFVSGVGTDASLHRYSFTDDTVDSFANYFYRLVQIDFDGKKMYSQNIQVDLNVVNSFELLQNYPNPFNAVTTIKFNIPQTEFVTLKVYNIHGQELSSLVSEELNPGVYEYNWNAQNISSGLYCYQLVAGSFKQTKKIVLIK